MSVYLLPEPNEKQERFFGATARFIAYGGARGGGKSWAVRRKAALACLNYPGLRVLIMRRTYPELRENHILPMQSELGGIARYNDSQKAFLFPNGSRLRFGCCDGDGGVGRYQGQEFDLIFLDEATQFTELQFAALSASLRGSNRFPKRIYLTCNPGGVGHDWVKRLFIDREFREGENPDDYCFIPASIADNRALREADPGYEKMLRTLPEPLRRAWLDGDWELASGRYFPEFSRSTHVALLQLPRGVPVWFAMDYGLDMLAGYWVALLPDGRAYVFRELCRSGLIISEAAAAIRALEDAPSEVYIAPPDLWNRRQDTGRSAAEIFSEHGVPLHCASNARVQGWYELREWLQVTETGPRLLVHPCCSELIRCMSSIQCDAKDPSDAAKEPHNLTHSPDALRYFAAARPSAPAAASTRDRTAESLFVFGR